MDTNSTTEKHLNKGRSIENEVQELFKKNGKIKSDDFYRLRQKYGDSNVADKIQKMYLDKYHTLSKKAKKFAKLIREKFPPDYPFHTLLEKARIAKDRYSLTENEFAEFQRIFEQELVDSKSPEILVPFNNITKVLGSVYVEHQGFNSNLGSKDWEKLQEIVKLHASTKLLHSQVILQALQYEVYAHEAINGVYDRNLHNPADAIHPVIAALFFPKIHFVDMFFLQANIAGIVTARYKNNSFSTRADYELFHALSTDPNDVVCDGYSIMTDLYNRAVVQKHLWNCVLNLRNGTYFHPSFNEFLSAIDTCRLNKYDNPDLVYGRNDGVIIKRLFNCFSFRPTVISTMPVFNVTVNPFQQTINPIVTKLPMINLRLPNIFSNNQDPVKLTDALEQNQMFIGEKGLFIPRKTNLLFSRDVLVFHVDRRSNVIKLADLQPFNIATLPTALSGFDQINSHIIDFDTSFTHGNNVYDLYSVVIANVNNLGKSKYIIGSSTICMKHSEIGDQLLNDDGCFHYDPYSVYRYSLDNKEGRKTSITKPITEISSINTPSELGHNLRTLAEECGMIFIYATKNQGAFKTEFNIDVNK
jgi:hypothetical protein